MPQDHKNQTLQRTCVGCFKKFNQGDLLAITRVKSGGRKAVAYGAPSEAGSCEVVVNIDGKIKGRSSYLCRKMECLKKTRKRKPKSGIEYGLKMKVGPEIWVAIEAHMSAANVPKN